uniref:Uncharacterized protein n=1 Tax=Chromera velia CCMP2878 TaxID=1169474 RepID=A0A0G4HC38_9ALVE|eukprot:Cvel_6298.t1-p1 / transcript=Cvel_6298.t1 / gene=Cvel_6298 / organism=Chromera_velia_CCMP2878 / gene_product=Ankyrin repeat and SOCS box protein 3, putative / transcript_product=Ankyrin repeat and SOCS box protein 3, putative / location=Cvel_scaffold305:99961-103544(-) / protein_length=263 / sequence_SO=supercontig / SO=protein_coding / is_pseudo=false
MKVLGDRIDLNDVQGWVTKLENGSSNPEIVESLLHVAVRIGRGDVVPVLLSSGFDVNVRSSILENMSPVDLAFKCERFDIFPLLAETMNSKTATLALHRAIQHGRDELMQLCFDKGGDQNKSSSELCPADLPPLYRAIQCGNVKCLRKLISAGADVKRMQNTVAYLRPAPDPLQLVPVGRNDSQPRFRTVSFKQTVLLAAVRGKNDEMASEMVEVLLAAGAKWTEEDEVAVQKLKSSTDPRDQEVLSASHPLPEKVRATRDGR